MVRIAIVSLSLVGHFFFCNFAYCDPYISTMIFDRVSLKPVEGKQFGFEAYQDKLHEQTHDNQIDFIKLAEVSAVSSRTKRFAIKKPQLARQPKITKTTTTTTSSPITESTKSPNTASEDSDYENVERSPEDQSNYRQTDTNIEDSSESESEADHQEDEEAPTTSTTTITTTTTTTTTTTLTPKPDFQQPSTMRPKTSKKEANKSSNNSSQEEPKPRKSSEKKNSKALFEVPLIQPKDPSICVPEAYLEFPPDLFGNSLRARGFVVIHIVLVCYMFYSLAVVTDRYFMPSLKEFADRLKLSEDVAGATLMSIGSSAAELFTATLGVFVAKGDVGTGTVVGSAVFNILFVIGICAFVSTTSAQLDWWPVLRDSVFYTFSVLVLIKFIYDEKVTGLESFLMLVFYGFYILIMVHNEFLKEWFSRTLQANSLTAGLLRSATSDGPDDVFSSSNPLSSMSQRNFFAGSKQKPVEDDAMYLAALLIIFRHKRLFRSQLRFQSATRYIITKRQHKIQESQGESVSRSNEVNYFGPETEPLRLKQGSSQRERMEAYATSAAMSKSKFSIVSRDDYEFWNRPPEEGENYYIWLAKIPVNFILHYTIPDCVLYPDKYLYTFFLSIVWTGLFAYLMVWMVTLIGYTFGVPDSVMGFTFLAAGTSVPDCYSSIHAARNGLANMAVSNSIGSNIFDILVGLALPWFIHNTIHPGVAAKINSRGIIYSVILLFMSIVVTLYLLYKYEWTLKPRLGLALLTAYGIFIVLASMLEFNLFGNVNPPPCPVV